MNDLSLEPNLIENEWVDSSRFNPYYQIFRIKKKEYIDNLSFSAECYDDITVYLNYQSKKLMLKMTYLIALNCLFVKEIKKKNNEIILDVSFLKNICNFTNIKLNVPFKVQLKPRGDNNKVFFDIRANCHKSKICIGYVVILSKDEVDKMLEVNRLFLQYSPIIRKFKRHKFMFFADLGIYPKVKKLFKYIKNNVSVDIIYTKKKDNCYLAKLGRPYYDYMRHISLKVSN